MKKNAIECSIFVLVHHLSSSAVMLQTASSQRYLQRSEDVRGKVEYTFNEQLPSRYIPVGATAASSTSPSSSSSSSSSSSPSSLASASVASWIKLESSSDVELPVEVSCREQELQRRLMQLKQQQQSKTSSSSSSSADPLPPTHVFAEGFRFMHQDLSMAASGMYSSIASSFRMINLILALIPFIVSSSI